MSDTRSVRSDTSRAEFPLRALALTAGMSAPQQAAFWLEGIATKVHRGPRVDTWGSARDRAAKEAGVELSMAKRIWQRWRDMKDVSGETLLKLMVAYERVCVATETKADNLRDQRMEMRGQRIAATDEGAAPAAQRMGAASDRALEDA